MLIVLVSKNASSGVPIMKEYKFDAKFIENERNDDVLVSYGRILFKKIRKK